MDFALKAVWKSWIVAANPCLVSWCLIYRKCAFFFWTCTLWCMDVTYEKQQDTSCVSSKKYLWAWKFHTTLVLAQGGTTNKTQLDSLNVADVLAELQSPLPRISLPLSLSTKRAWGLDSRQFTLNLHLQKHQEYGGTRKEANLYITLFLCSLFHFIFLFFNHYNVFQGPCFPKAEFPVLQSFLLCAGTKNV